MFEQMIKWYFKVSAADAYEVGFIYKETLYTVRVDHLPTSWLVKDHCSSSHGGWEKIKLRIPAATKKALIANGDAIALGTHELLTANTKYNRGENFERIITERAGQTWVKDSIPFWVSGDIRIDDQEIQIKFDGAEITTERTMRRAIANGVA